MRRYYSPFWLAWAAGLITLSPRWAERDESNDPDTGIHPLEDLPMAAWLRLGDDERGAVLASYAPQRRLCIRHAPDARPAKHLENTHVR